MVIFRNVEIFGRFHLRNDGTVPDFLQRKSAFTPALAGDARVCILNLILSGSEIGHGKIFCIKALWGVQ
jgi:hypothetical protein